MIDFPDGLQGERTGFSSLLDVSAVWETSIVKTTTSSGDNENTKTLGRAESGTRWRAARGMLGKNGQRSTEQEIGKQTWSHTPTGREKKRERETKRDKRGDSKKKKHETAATAIICRVSSHQATVVVRDLADLLDPLLEHPVGRRVGHHQSRELVLVLGRLRSGQDRPRTGRRRRRTE